MLTRRIAGVLALMLCLAGCASAGSPAASSSAASSSAASPSSAAPPSSAASAGTETITGTIEAGIEPHCLLLQDSTGSHLLVFDDAAMRADATVGKKVTLTGRSEPKMMSTCMQGIPFIVTSVTPA